MENNNKNNTVNGVEASGNPIIPLPSNMEVLTTNASNPSIVVQNSAEASAGNGPAGLVQSMAAMAVNGPAGRVQNTGAVRGPPVMMPAEKPEKFDGLNFKRWQQKMLFYLTTIGLVRFLTDDPPILQEDETDPKVRMTFLAWKDSDYLCRNYVMNCLADSLYNVYSSKASSKELWESLDRKYKTEDAGSKKYIVGRFLEFKMVDNKTVVSQVQDLQLIFHDIQAEGMTISESFQVASVIEKLPSGWKEFKNYLKHKRKETSLEDLVVRLRIEEDNRGSDKRFKTTSERANIVEHGEGSRGKKPANKLGAKGAAFKKKNQQKFVGKCFNCDKEGHRAADCRKP